MKTTSFPSSAQMKKNGSQVKSENNSGRGRKPGKRRGEIIQIAHRLFAEKGFHNVSFDDIALDIGIKREGLYYYFKSPSDILLEIVKPSLIQLIERLELITGSELHPVSKLFLGIESHTKIFDRTALDAINLCASTFSDEKFGKLHTAFRPLYKRYENLWMDILDGDESQDTFNKLGNRKVVVFAILGMCNWMVRWFNEDGDANLDEVAKTFFAVASYGLLGRLDGDKPTLDTILGDRMDEIRAFKLVHGTP